MPHKRGSCELHAAADLEWLSDRLAGRYQRRTYNCILCLSVLEFVRDPEALLIYLTSLLKVGVLLMVTVPNQNSYLRGLEWFGFEYPTLAWWIPGLTHLVTPIAIWTIRSSS